MSAAYFRAAIPEPVRILGRKLKPFSLGHYLLMRRFDCAFVAEEPADATKDDLLLGVLICSMDYAEFLRFIERNDFIRQIEVWGTSCGIFDFREKAKLFMTYLEAGLEQPDYWVEDDSGEPSGAHWSQTVLTTLTGQLGYSRKEAMNSPLAQCLADFYKHAENMGSVRLMTPEEIAITNGAKSQSNAGA